MLLPMKVLFTYSIPKEGLNALDKRFELIYPNDKIQFSEDEIIRFLPEIDIIVTIFTIPFNTDWFYLAPKLKLIANYGVGYNNIPVEEATNRGIIVTNTPNAVTEPTAEMTLALLLSLARKVTLTDRLIRNNQVVWGLMNNLGTTLNGKTLGIIGLGRIGKSVAKKAAAFGMKIVYFSRNRVEESIENELKAKYLPFLSILSTADVISIHTPLNKSTKHLFNADAFNRMKNTAIIVNTARGAIINESDLLWALENAQIAGAALDVFEFEPKITEGLQLLNNVVLTPHIGTGTMETRIETSAEVAANILGYFLNGNPPNRVN